MVAPAMGNISIKTHLMTMPFIKHTQRTNIILLLQNVF